MVSLRLSLRPWKSAPMTQWMALGSLSFILVGFNSVYWMGENVSTIVEKLEAERIVTVYLDPSVGKRPDEPHLQTGAIQDAIRTQLGSSRISSDYTDAQTFLKDLESSYPELAREVQALGADAEWVTPRFFTLKGAVSDSTIEELKKIPGIEGIESSDKKVHPVTQSLKAIFWVSRLFTAGLGLAFVTLLFLIARLNRQCQSEVASMIRQWGGTRLQMRLPQIWNQFFLACSAAVLSIAAWIYCQPLLMRHMGALSPYLRELKLQPPIKMLAVAFSAALFGWVSGWLTSDAELTANEQ